MTDRYRGGGRGARGDRVDDSAAGGWPGTGRTLATAHHWATRMLAGFVLDLAFIGTNGISRERGLTTPDPAVADDKTQVVRAAHRRVFVGVHTKFGSPPSAASPSSPTLTPSSLTPRCRTRRPTGTRCSGRRWSGSESRGHRARPPAHVEPQHDRSGVPQRVALQLMLRYPWSRLSREATGRPSGPRPGDRAPTRRCTKPHPTVRPASATSSAGRISPCSAAPSLGDVGTGIVRPCPVGPGGLLDDAGHVAHAYVTDALVLVRPH